MIRAICLAQLIPQAFKPSMPTGKFYFRLSLPVHSAFKISFPVWADIIKRPEIKFKGESLETFFGYDHVKYQITAY